MKSDHILYSGRLGFNTLSTFLPSNLTGNSLHEKLELAIGLNNFRERVIIEPVALSTRLLVGLFGQVSDEELRGLSNEVKGLLPHTLDVGAALHDHLDALHW